MINPPTSAIPQRFVSLIGIFAAFYQIATLQATITSVIIEIMQ